MNKAVVPNCPWCKNKTVRADAGVLTKIPYWYCRTCKEEVKEETEEDLTVDKWERDELLIEFEKMLEKSNL